MTPTEALKEWARKRSKNLKRLLRRHGDNTNLSCNERAHYEAAILSGVVKGLESAKATDGHKCGKFACSCVDGVRAVNERIDALLKDLKERTT